MHRQHAQILDSSQPFSAAELDAITATMPLTARYAIADGALDGWALLFRDHYLEHSVGFVLAMQQAGVPPEWIFTMAKGDHTRNRQRIHATFLSRGYRSEVFDNAWIDGDPSVTEDDRRQADEVAAKVDDFVTIARADGRRVLAIDDGGLLARGYGRTDNAQALDAALELTVSGLKRIAAAGLLGIPVWNMARSAVKTKLGYPEIADSCLRRLRAMLPTVKFIGRNMLLLGFGTLGSRLAHLLRAQGCRVCVVETDVTALITAAEAGYCTHRTVSDALDCTRPFAVLGTTGECALSADDLHLLPNGVYLAPFATRDFSILRSPDLVCSTRELPGVGQLYQLSDGPGLYLLGDGRSMNLFEADSIPNQGYDAYRAGTLIAAKSLCATIAEQRPGIHTAAADAAIAASGLYDAYFDLYLDGKQPKHSEYSDVRSHAEREHACVVGYGVAGRLHAAFLAEAGLRVTAVDPKHAATSASFPMHARIEDLDTGKDGHVDLWSVCAPTAEHLSALRQILARDPAARVLLEKPACHGHEIAEFEALLDAHPRARVVVNDQYLHASALTELRTLIRALEPGKPIHQVTVTFTKDRRKDIDAGRFIDRTYGVLGYEWLHMLAVIRQILPAELVGEYLAADPRGSDLYPVYDERLFVATLTERTTLEHDRDRVHLELASSITGPLIPLGAPPAPGGLWQRELRAHDDRHRHVTARAGRTRFTLHLEPVTAPGGWQLQRNQHRLTADRDGEVVHDQIIMDSPLHTSLSHALSALRGSAPLQRPDLRPLSRIAALADLLKTHACVTTESLATAAAA